MTKTLLELVVGFDSTRSVSTTTFHQELESVLAFKQTKQGSLLVQVLTNTDPVALKDDRGGWSDSVHFAHRHRRDEVDNNFTAILQSSHTRSCFFYAIRFDATIEQHLN